MYPLSIVVIVHRCILTSELTNCILEILGNLLYDSYASEQLHRTFCRT